MNLHFLMTLLKHKQNLLYHKNIKFVLSIMQQMNFAKLLRIIAAI